MKNMLILGVLAVVCFTAAGALSIYLQKSPATEETKDATAGKKKKDKEKDDDIPAVRTTPTVSSEETAKLTAELRDQANRLKDRENRLKVKEQQVELILGDIRSERDAFDRLRGQIAVEMKLATDQASLFDKKAADLEEQRKLLAKGNAETAKTRTEIDKDERTNITKMAALYDTMAPENAAKILQQMADTGKLDTAVKILAVMKPAKASKLLSEMPDVSLAGQLLEKMKGLRNPAPSPPGTPGS